MIRNESHGVGTPIGIAAGAAVLSTLQNTGAILFDTCRVG